MGLQRGTGRILAPNVRARAGVPLDLPYQAEDFSAVDAFIDEHGLDEIAEKHFPHERAFELDGVRLEILLVARDARGRHTDFWAVLRHDWPPDTFEVTVGALRVASMAALVGYRRGFDAREDAKKGSKRQRGPGSAR